MKTSLSREAKAKHVRRSGVTPFGYALICATIIIPFSAARGHADDDPDAFSMEPSGEAPANPSVIGGRRPQNPLDWPASFKLKYGGLVCTATAIGPTVVITAAHCVPNRRRGSLSVNGVTVRVTCEHHPEYANNSLYDIALCSSTTPIQLPQIPGGVPSQFESLQIDTLPSEGTEVTIQGYGCRLAGGHVGILYIGDATISDVPGSQPYFITEGAAVCGGDSGGAVFPRNDGPHRAVLGINAQGDLEDTSFITAIGDPLVSTFIKGWAARTSSNICGLSGGNNCHE